MKKKKQRSGKRKRRKVPHRSTHSEIHRLDREHAKVKKELHEVNRIIKPAIGQKKKNRFSPILIATWIVIALLFTSMIISTIGSYKIVEDGIKANAENHIEKVRVEREDTPVQTTRYETKTGREYYGVTLNELQPDKREYHPGDDASIKTRIALNEVDKLDVQVSYDLYFRSPDAENDKEKKIYSYSDDVYLDEYSGSVVKDILLTENYQEGDYILDFNARFDVDGIKYSLPGTTRFRIVEIPKPSIAERAGRAFTGMTLLQSTLLIAALLLNMIILTNSLYQELKERQLLKSRQKIGQEKEKTKKKI